jgi:rhodanese-related sulfurtransferase
MGASRRARCQRIEWPAALPQERPMMTHLVHLTAIAAMAVGLTASHAIAQGVGIYEATLAEANQATPEVSTDELRRILAADSALVLDTRSRDEFDAGHIPGARRIDAPAADRVKAIEALVKGNKAAALVLYCNGPFCQASRQLAAQLVAAGFTNVRRYQLGIPIWRALGGPTAIELGGVVRVHGADQTAVFFDGRSAQEFAKGSLRGAHNVPVDELVEGRLKKIPLPEDDFNRRIVLFGRDAAQARTLADVLSKRPWHNVAYYPGAFETLVAAVGNR